MTDSQEQRIDDLLDLVRSIRDLQRAAFELHEMRLTSLERITLRQAGETAELRDELHTAATRQAPGIGRFARPAEAREIRPRDTLKGGRRVVRVDVDGTDGDGLADYTVHFADGSSENYGGTETVWLWDRAS